MPPPDALDADSIAAQLGTAYTAIDAGERARHPARIAEIRQPGDIAGEALRLAGGAHAVTVVAADVPGALSLIAGALTAHGFDIETGDLFMVRRPVARRTTPRGGRFAPSRGRPGMPAARPMPSRGASQPV